MNGVFLDYDTVSADDVDTTSLERTLPGIVYFGTSTADQVPERVADAEVLFINKIRVTADIMAAAPSLRLICAAATGTDNIDLDAARNRGIAVCNIRDYCTASVVQHVFALLLSLNHHLEAYGELLASGQWRRHPQFCMLDFPITELQGRTLGIVGYGTLGKAVARAAEAFGLHILIAQRPGTSNTPGRVLFDDLLPQVDVLSLHCPLTDATRYLVDEAALKRMKPSALLINTARGGLVDAQALAWALRKGRLAGAGIDVLETEPPTNGNPLLATDIPNLIVTPHIAWAAREARQRAIDAMAANVDAFKNGQRLNRVD